MTYRQYLGFGIAVALISIIAEAIGTLKFPLGPGEVILFPLVWAILLGGLISVQPVRRLDVGTQRAAAQVLELGIMIFIVRLGTLIGPSIGKLLNVGWALAFQELGHMFGTVIIALPLAVVLKMGRTSIGATYSIDREPNLAFMAEKFGGDSDEYRGALAIYVIGSVLGAVYVALLAGFLGGAGVFDPVALAMGSGVGSGSMMAAASAAIAAEFPTHKQTILAVAGASNLITEVIGVYATVFVALPLAERLYRFWQRVFGYADQKPASAAANNTTESRTSAATEYTQRRQYSIVWIIGTSLLVGVLMLVSNYVGVGYLNAKVIGGMVLLVAISIGSFLIKRVIPPVPAVVWASLVGIVITAGGTPLAAGVTGLVQHIDFLAMVTPVLAFAGLSLGKDLPALRSLGLRFFVVAVVVYTATYLSATVIAELLI